MTHSVVVPLIDASATLRSPSAGLRTSASGSEVDPSWSIKITDMSGSVITDLTPGTGIWAEVDKITWTLNAPDECEFHFPKNAFNAGDLRVLGSNSGPHEVQVYRNGDIVFWGPITSINGAGADGALKCHAAGPDWYLNRRFVDGVVVNLLDNGDFESDLDDWTTFDAGGGLTASISTNTFITGSQSAKLVSTSPDEEFLIQSATIGANAIGTLLTVSAWFLIDSITKPAHSGDMLAPPGLYIEGRKSGVFQGNNAYVIDTATPQGKWTKASTTIWVPPGETWEIDVRLYAPQGTIHWDDAKLVRMDSLFCGTHTGLTLLPIDISTSIQKLVAHVQNPTVGKSHLNITVDAESVGVKLLKVYQYVDHVQFDQAMREFIERDDGIDYFIRLTPTTRTFRSFSGKRGTDRTGEFTLSYVAGADDGDVPDYRFTSDGSACITRQVVLGEDNGPDREQGESAGASAIGGTILQDVRQASQDATVDSLQPFADELISRFSSVPLTIELDVLGKSELIGYLHPGDLVAVTITDGYVDVEDDLRIMQITLDAVKNMMTLTLTTDTL